MKIKMHNAITGKTRIAKTGFSWTTLFFGWLVPLFRGDWKWVFLMFFICIATFGFSNFVMCFIYNKIYAKGLLADGYLPSDAYGMEALKSEMGL